MPKPSDFAKFTFVGISTEQNTANLIPCLHLMPAGGRYTALDTKGAREGGWGAGVASVLTSRGWRCDAMPFDGTSVNSLRDVLATIPGPVCWLLGGGQKVHTLALWEQFHEAGPGDAAAYTDPASGETTLYWFEEKDGDRLAEELRRTEVKLEADEVLRAFGRQLVSSRPPPLPVIAEVDRFCTDGDYRRKWFRLGGEQDERLALAASVTSISSLFELLGDPPARGRLRQVLGDDLEKWLARPGQIGPPDPRAMASHVLKELARAEQWRTAFNVLPNAPIATPFGEFTLLSAYFEALVAHACTAWSASSAMKVAAINAQFGKTGSAVWDAECDVLMLTGAGTLVSLDAKTFDVKEKDLAARLYTIQQASGHLAQFIPVLPYFPADFEHDLPSSELRGLPFQLDRNRRRFLVLSDSPANFWLTREKHVITRHATQVPGSVRCQTLQDYFLHS
ncbi:hypothetical protein LBMAG42_57390 [Deltaproteobacteria bacterium]|nr:hypothetical protein LBMAG42_57390 [Deltaproteobacteria bacterium]